MTTKKTNPTRNLTKKEAVKFFDLLDEPRRLAYRISKDPQYSSDVKKAFASIEKKLSNIRIDYYWGILTNFEL